MRLFHSTTAVAAASILTVGFRDTTFTYLTGRLWTGVWLSDRPLDGNEGAAIGALLAVDLDLADDELAEFEWVEDGKPYREWLVPAEVINRRAAISLADEES